MLDVLAALGVHVLSAGYAAFRLVVGEGQARGLAFADRDLAGEGSLHGTRLTIDDVEGDGSDLVGGVFVVQLQRAL